MSLIFATIPAKRLLSGITSASAEFYLNDIKGFDGETDVAPADLGTQHYCVFRNDTGSRIEIMEIDPSTISAGPITIVRRGLSFYGDRTTETTALKLDWSANETIVQLGTDAPQIFQYLKEYIDAASIAGAVPASTVAAGIVVEASQAELDAKTDTKVISSTTYKLFASPAKRRGANYNDYVADAGATDAYAITPAPAITAYTVGQIFTFKANTANTGAATLAVSGLASKGILKNYNENLGTGDIVANQIVMVVYDGNAFQILSPVSNLTPKNKSVTAGATINGATLPVPVYQNKTDNEFYACDGNNTAAMKFLGFAVSNGTDGAAMSVQFTGIVSGFTGLDEGEKYYLSDTVGTIQNSPGTYEVLVGIAISTTELLIQKGRRYAKGTYTVGTSVSNQAITTGFRPSRIRIMAFHANSSGGSASWDAAVYLTWANGSAAAIMQYETMSSGIAATSTGTDASLHDSSGNYVNIGVSTITDTGFTITLTETGSYPGGGELVWEAEGEL